MNVTVVTGGGGATAVKTGAVTGAAVTAVAVAAVTVVAGVPPEKTYDSLGSFYEQNQRVSFCHSGHRVGICLAIESCVMALSWFSYQVL